jgi:putative FmdB family regulatory protein
MPIYEYPCFRVGHRIETIRKYEDRAVCPCGCGAKRLISAPAKTALKWGDTQWTGKYDKGLGTTLRDANHRKQLMASRNLRELQDGEVESHTRAVQADAAEHDANVAAFEKHKAETGDVGVALARTFPCKEIA